MLRQRCCQWGQAPAHHPAAPLSCSAPCLLPPDLAWGRDKEGVRLSNPSGGKEHPLMQPAAPQVGQGMGTRWEPWAGLTLQGRWPLWQRGWGWSVRRARPRDAPRGTTTLGPNSPMAPSALEIYEGPPSLGIVKHLIENTVTATRRHGPRAGADGHPGAPCHRGPSTAQMACSGRARPGSHLVGTAWLRVHPGQASVERGEAPGKPPTDVLPPTQEGALSQNFG